MLLKKFFAALFSMSAVICSAGISGNIPQDKLIPIESGFSEGSESRPRAITYKPPSRFINTLDSINIEITLSAGEFVAVFVDADAGTLGYSPREVVVPAELEPWVNTAPDWIKRQLRQNLSRLDPTYALSLADILASSDPLWRDELYYCMAHLAHEILELPEMYFLLPENVREIYARDSSLNYVEIVDIDGRLVYGNPFSPKSADDNALFGAAPLIWTPERDLPSGVYLIRARAGDSFLQKKVIYLK